MTVKRIYEGSCRIRKTVFLEPEHIEAFKRYAERELTDEEKKKSGDKLLGCEIRAVMQQMFKRKELLYKKYCEEHGTVYVPPVLFSIDET